jgi:trimeric autotransporter adhesin
MANTLNKNGITTGNTVEAYHVTQSIDAFTGAVAYDISLSGSFNVTGSITTTGSNGTINGLFVSRGGGNVSTNISIGATTNFSSSATGVNNFAAGNNALCKNTTGNNNTAIGFRALHFNTTGINNTAIGNSCFTL